MANGATTTPLLLRAARGRWPAGPEGFDNPECDIDFRIGGRYRIVMRAPAGARFPIEGEYLEIEPPMPGKSARLVMTEDISGENGAWGALIPAGPQGGGLPMRVVLYLTLEERGAGARLTLEARFHSQADRTAMAKAGAEDGWAESLEKMRALLARR